jgi:hypothetical protein
MKGNQHFLVSPSFRLETGDSCVNRTPPAEAAILFCAKAVADAGAGPDAGVREDPAVGC